MIQPASSSREVILCVDDEPGVLNVLKDQLEDAFGGTCEVESATSGAAALELASALDPASEPLAVVIADQMMPGMTGTELLGRLHGHHPGLRKVLLTGQAGLDAVVYAVNHYGLDLYIAKPWAETDLRLSVAGLLRQFRLEQENHHLLEDLRRKNLELGALNASLEAQVRERTRALEEANAKLERLAVTDGLTGLYNHRFFQERLLQEVERARRTNEPVTLLMVDVDHFKRWNDTHGHLAGDGALRQLAGLLSAGRRLNDVVARYGGEEFAVILSGTPRKAGALVAEYLRRRVADSRFDPLPTAGGLTISVGIACCPDDAADPTALVQAADQALYRAKAAGRNRVVEA